MALNPSPQGSKLGGHGIVERPCRPIALFLLRAGVSPPWPRTLCQDQQGLGTPDQDKIRAVELPTKAMPEGKDGFVHNAVANRKRCLVRWLGV